MNEENKLEADELREEMKLAKNTYINRLKTQGGHIKHSLALMYLGLESPEDAPTTINLRDALLSQAIAIELLQENIVSGTEDEQGGSVGYLKRTFAKVEALDKDVKDLQEENIKLKKELSQLRPALVN